MVGVEIMAAISIDDRLNLVFPLESSAGDIYVYSIPIDYMVYKANYKLLSKTFNRLIADKIDFRVAPGVALFSLLEVAEESDDTEKVQSGLLSEIRRLTSVSLVVEGARQVVGLQDCIGKSLLSAELIDEIENQLVFFTLALYVPQRADRATWLNGQCFYWKSLNTALKFTAWTDYFLTLTQAVDFGMTGAALLRLLSVLLREQGSPSALKTSLDLSPLKSLGIEKNDEGYIYLNASGIKKVTELGII